MVGSAASYSIAVTSPSDNDERLTNIKCTFELDLSGVSNCLQSRDILHIIHTTYIAIWQREKREEYMGPGGGPKARII